MVENKHSIQGNTINISIGGLCCKTPQSLHEDTLVSISIEADQEKTITIEFATVVRSEAENGSFATRCRFRGAEIGLEEVPRELQDLINSEPTQEGEAPGPEQRKSQRHKASWPIKLQIR